MEQNTSSPRQKTFPVWPITVIVTCLILTLMCYRISRFFFPEPTRASEQFPNSDIIYNAGRKLGFVNADGSGTINVPFILKTPVFWYSESWGQPLISGDGKNLIVTYSTIPVGTGNLFVASIGQFAIYCKQWGASFAWLAADQEHIFVKTDQGLAKYSPADCGMDHAPVKVYSGVYGPLSPDEQYSAEVKYESEYPHNPTLIIHQLNTRNEKTIGKGDFPAWSRDGKWLAYTGPDGIYIVNVEYGTEPRRLVEHHNPDENGKHQDPNQKYLLYHLNPRPSLFFPPMVSWSSDGQWLVYSLYKEGLGEDAEGSVKFYSIFKVNIATGKETKIVDDGLSPDWRWPAKTP